MMNCKFWHDCIVPSVMKARAALFTVGLAFLLALACAPAQAAIAAPSAADFDARMAPAWLSASSAGEVAFEKMGLASGSISWNASTNTITMKNAVVNVSAQGEAARNLCYAICARRRRNPAPHGHAPARGKKCHKRDI